MSGTDARKEANDAALKEERDEAMRKEAEQSREEAEKAVLPWESIEGIASEMSNACSEDICPWWADGGDCARCPLGGGDKCVFTKYAARFVEAWKTHRKAVLGVLGDVKEMHGRGLLKHNPFSAEDNVNLNLLFGRIDDLIRGLGKDPERYFGGYGDGE